MTAMTRVELHNASDSDYELLHEAMERLGFSRTIKSDSGTIYKLPPAEYYFTGNSTRAELLEQAKRAADLTGCRYAVLVSETNGTTWTGLDVVNTKTAVGSSSAYR